jgi:ABC-type transport system involved in Fe-S cluster assembly fused permease/ATPase subunit
LLLLFTYRYSRSAADPASQQPPASMEEVIRAGMLANAHDFIMTFPDGYSTIVGERGIRYVLCVDVRPAVLIVACAFVALVVDSSLWRVCCSVYSVLEALIPCGAATD